MGDRIKAQNENTNGKRKYKLFDAKLLETDGNIETNHKRKESLTLPPIQLNLEHGKRNGNHRRILTAYQVYCMEQKPTLKENNRSMCDAKLSKRLAIEWKKMRKKERKEYGSKAQKIVNDFLQGNK